MDGKTLTRAHLAEAVYQEVGLSRSELAELVDSILSEIGDSLVRDGIVKISSFGTFSVRSKGQRIGRNPKTGEEVPILPRRVLVFRPSQVLKDRINGIETSGDSRGVGLMDSPVQQTTGTTNRPADQWPGVEVGRRFSDDQRSR